jgi:hypothetical protein
MPLHWIFYRGKDSPDGVVIIDGETLVDARMSARRRGFENGVFFAEGHILNPELAAIVEPQEIGRFLSLSEANWIIRRFEVVNSDPKLVEGTPNPTSPVDQQSPRRLEGRPVSRFFERTFSGYVVRDADKREVLRVEVNLTTPKMLGENDRLRRKNGGTDRQPA